MGLFATPTVVLDVPRVEWATLGHIGAARQPRSAQRVRAGRAGRTRLRSPRTEPLGTVVGLSLVTSLPTTEAVVACA